MASFFSQCIKREKHKTHIYITMIKQIWGPCQPETKKITGWTIAGQTNDIVPGPNPLMETLCRGRRCVLVPIHRLAIKEDSIAINRALG